MSVPNRFLIEKEAPDFKAFFEGVTSLSLILSPELKIVAVTDSYLKATMTERSNILGKGIFEVFPDNPDDPKADGVRNLKLSLERVLETKQPDSMAIQKYDIQGADGKFEIRYWSPINSPIFKDGKLTHIIHRVDDVTEFMRIREDAALLKTKTGQMEADIYQRGRELQAANENLRETREELERFFTMSLDMLCISGFDGYFKKVNPSFQNVLGYTPEELCASSYLEFIHPDDIEITKNEVERQLKRGELVLNFENRYRNKDGSYRLLAWKSTPFGDVMYATARDITQIRANENQIAELNADLQKTNEGLASSNKELESFSYSVSHDLRAPLRSMTGFSQILLEDAADRLNDEDRANVARIHGAARKMGELIDGLLNLSRLSRRELSHDPVNLSGLVNTAIEDLRRMEPHRNVEFLVEKDIRVVGDAPLLGALLRNLVDNAWKFTSKNPKAVIEFGTRKEKGKNIYFVRDNGAGFDMKYADKLFGAFQRLHSANEFDGTGVGLATAQRIIQRHGGHIWAEAKVGEGAVFNFTIENQGALL